MTGPLYRDPEDQYRILEADGSVVAGETVPALPDETLVGMYHDMVLVRTFDRRAVSLQRQGRMGTYPPLAGQEGAQVGSAYALCDEDWTFPSYREHGVALVRGVSLDRTLRYWMGHEEGNRVPDGVNQFTVSVPIATQVLHAVGAAWAAKLKDDRRAFVCYFGDGATSEGDFHEGLNFAGVFDTPSVFFCNNNQWAISTPRSKQTASASIAAKAAGYGFAGVQVDGMDPLAVYAVTRAATEKAKSPATGERRPTLVEAVQYRFGAHTTADDPTVYRNPDEVEEWRKRDPLPRLETYLRDTGRLDDEHVDAIEREAEAEVAAAIEAAESAPAPQPEEMFEHVYADAPDRLDAERRHLNRLREEYGDDAFLGG